MSKAAKNILTLNHDEAMDFFMKSEQYHGFELPEYFSFDEVLKYVREKVRTISYEECLKKGVSPDSLSDVNLDILLRSSYHPSQSFPLLLPCARGLLRKQLASNKRFV